MHSISDFEAVLVTACDIHGVPRGRFAFGESLPGVCKNGLGIAQAALFCGMMCDIPTGLTDYSEGGWTNGTIIPALTTLKPLSWLSYGDQKVGHVLCDFLDQSREPEISSSRETTLRQLNALQQLGYHIHTSLDLSFTIFPRGSLVPVSLHEDISKLVHTLTKSLTDANLPVVSIGQGLEPGQLLVSLGEQAGIEAVDSLHWLHYALTSLCARAGYDITRMTRPVSEVSGNGNSYIMRLTTVDQRNAFGDSAEELSSVARHWIAGLIQHGPAITALARPTMNCYLGSDKGNGLLNSWTTDNLNRTHRLQVQRSSSGLTLTDILPSAASNPYIAFAALLAAGVDGISSKMGQGEKMSAILKNPLKIPSTLPDALASLEEDKVFQNLIGPKLVYRFGLLKRSYELERLDKWLAENVGKDILEFERSVYLASL